MWQYALKVTLTAVVVVAVAELAKRSSFRGALLASLPLFLVLPVLLRTGWPFWPSLGATCAITVVAYFALIGALERPGIRIQSQRLEGSGRRR